MSAHVLLNLLSELKKRDKMRGLPSILSLFRYECNKNITSAKFQNDLLKNVVGVVLPSNPLLCRYYVNKICILHT